MKQMSLGESGFERKTKRTRKREFLDEMNLVVPWAELVSLIAPHAPAPGAKGGRPPFAVETMLRIHFLQQWFNLSDPAMEEALYDTPLYREFAGLDMGEGRKAVARLSGLLPDEPHRILHQWQTGGPHGRHEHRDPHQYWRLLRDPCRPRCLC